MPYTQHPHLGKFEGNYSQWLARVLYDIVGISGQDEDLGEVDGFGWYGLIRGRQHSWIVNETGQGFFSYHEYSNKDEAEHDWFWLEMDYDEFCYNTEENN